MSVGYLSVVCPLLETPVPGGLETSGGRINQIERFERMKDSAERLVTGNINFTTRTGLYAELGWETIAKGI